MNQLILNVLLSNVATQVIINVFSYFSETDYRKILPTQLLMRDPSLFGVPKCGEGAF